MCPYIDLGFIDYPVYGLLAVVGILSSVLLMLFLAKKRDADLLELTLICAAGFLGVLLGGRILYALTRYEDVSYLFSTREYYTGTEFFSKLMDLTSGLVFYGGLYGGMLFGFVFAKLRKVDIGKYADVFSVGIPAFHIFGRVGCFFAGCCYGVKSEFGFSGRVITQDVRERASRFPVQLLEAFFLLLITVLLIFLLLKRVLEGRLMAVYLSIYAVLRFFLEFLRGDEIRGKFLCFSTSQWISLLTLSGVFIYFIGMLIKRKRADKKRQ